jgi:hypothetical protein
VGEIEDLLRPLVKEAGRDTAFQPADVPRAVGPAGGLPDATARGGGYSAIAESNVVGPEGGQVLADRTVELINSLWPE